MSSETVFGCSYAKMKSLIPTSCETCIIRSVCGGHDLPLFRKIGCVSAINLRPFKVDPNDMNPHDPVSFWEKWNDVGGLLDLSIQSPIYGPVYATLPRYIPKIHDGYARNRLLSSQSWVGLSLNDLLSAKRKSQVGRKFNSKSEVCGRFRISPTSKILAIGVDHDKFIENFWEKHRSHRLPEVLRQLGIDAVTTPNYSLFTDVTGFQMVRNLKRTLLCAQRLSDADVATVIHINAFRQQHWDIWRNFLLEHEEVSVVAKEFETGSGEKELLALADLQDGIGRALHPVIIGGGRFYRTASKRFSNFTIVDSYPFVAATQREAISLRNKSFFREKWPTALGETIDDLLDHNLLFYPKYLERDETTAEVTERAGPIGQLALGL